MLFFPTSSGEAPSVAFPTRNSLSASASCRSFYINNLTNRYSYFFLPERFMVEVNGKFPAILVGSECLLGLTQEIGVYFQLCCNFIRRVEGAS